MSTLGRVANSLTNVNNENILTLANLNFDFTLFKFDAPKEFASIGNSLSLRRRADAEEGKIHKTARKLAALFEPLVPSTPNLLKAYGIRSSEIASDPQANPKATKDHGPFTDFIGIDGSSLWAAATSSAMSVERHAALTMYLLACMLARAWEADKSISIWTELVSERQAEIMRLTEDGPQLTSIYMAACQDITREELAKWDASARSWLRSADEVKRVPYTKFMLIAKNISVNLCQGKTTYQNVIDVWRHALLGMEDLIHGRPQQASDGAVLLALSAWHICPDLMVLGSSTKSVEFHDPLVQAGGIITIGLQCAVDNGDAGMHWSLTPSQYQFYEREAEVNTGDGTSRITMDELLIMALGSLFSAWNISENEQVETAKWLVKIFDLIPSSTDLSWLAVLVDSSHKFLDLNTYDSVRCSTLITYGRRRAKNLLGFQKSVPQPFFGLRNRPLLRALSLKPGSQRGMAYLRAICETVSDTGLQFVIRYQERWRGTTRTIFATAIPHHRISSKRLFDGSFRREKTHCYWFPSAQKYPPCFECVAGCSGAMPESQCREACRYGEVMDCTPGHTCGHSGMLSEDQCLDYDPGDIREAIDIPVATFFWYNPPTILRDTFEAGYETVIPLSFRFCGGETSSFSLFVAVPDRPGDVISDEKAFVRLDTALKSGARTEYSVHHATVLLEEKQINPASLQQYLTWYVGSSTDISALSRGSHLPPRQEEPFGRDMSMLLSLNGLEKSHYKALTALRKAQTIFAPFNELTIPLRAASLTLCDVGWFFVNNAGPFNRRITMQERLACIVGFESCSSLIEDSDFDNVFAVSFGNSIFVASILLTDPLNHEKCYGQVLRLTGNVGMPGISLLISPKSELKRTAPGYDLRLVPHDRYDHSRENNFQSTSLHLSFTNWTEPLIVANQGKIDQSVFYVESVVSVHDRGTWVADFEIFGDRILSFLQPSDGEWEFGCKCTGDGNKGATSIDSWEEIIDPPENVGIVRAHENWAARLAAQAVLLAHGGASVLVVDPQRTFCVKCISNRCEDLGEPFTRSIIIVD